MAQMYALILYEDEQNRDIFLNIKEENSFLPTERQDLEIEIFKIVDNLERHTR